jgi:cell division control protein 45
MHNIPKVFDLERGGDTRCIIFDNHRPLHLANIYSRHSVVVFEDADMMEADSIYIPSDHSDADEASDSAEANSESDEDDDNDDDENEEVVMAHSMLEENELYHS